ncbi:uncharacterized protein ARMOST_02384 [Armillaria ostoyae]|uniref:Uncharacterized protein n=1 Tax=Armillaria ostoyae TaxID=47428 RepID=A0A284QRJ4_ARMOS|nr:uncharacterized protein ARMOST_02384 [Armillaria ostoyae]
MLAVLRHNDMIYHKYAILLPLYTPAEVVWTQNISFTVIDYVPNSSALQISKNLYQVYINSQSNIHNGLQGRDGKAIVTVKNVAPGKLPTPAEASKS